tara:strand:- start:5547 stop:5954 length:408 start_codon:yes stop_codon:yes gene_type:complete
MAQLVIGVELPNKLIHAYIKQQTGVEPQLELLFKITPDVDGHEKVIVTHFSITTPGYLTTTLNAKDIGRYTAYFEREYATFKNKYLKVEEELRDDLYRYHYEEMRMEGGMDSLSIDLTDGINEMHMKRMILGKDA